MPFTSLNPFRTRKYLAVTPSSNSAASFAVMQRGELINARFATTPIISHTKTANSVDISKNGTAVTGWSSRAVTTSTGNSSYDFGAPSIKTYVEDGDVVSVSLSSCAGGSLSVLIREF